MHGKRLLVLRTVYTNMHQGIVAINQSQQLQKVTFPSAFLRLKPAIWTTVAFKMLRRSVLVWTSSFFVLCLCRAQGFELPRALRVIDHRLPSGDRQSPIQFNTDEMIFEPYVSNPLQTKYKPAKYHLSIEQGSTLQVTFDGPAGALCEGGLRYNLQQFHFHSPTEHTFGDYPQICDSSLFKAERGETEEFFTGERYSNHKFVMEMHLVHQTSGGELAVIAVMFKLGKPNEFLNKFWGNIESIGQNGTSVGLINVDYLNVDDLDLSDTFIHYIGSLTTDPYTEGVVWAVMCGNWNTISPQQLDTYKKRFPGANNRETQPLNGREVVIKFALYAPFGEEIQPKRSSAVQSS